MHLLNIDDVAALTGLSASTLAKRRCAGLPPAFFKLGRIIKYAAADVDTWILSQRRTSTWCAANDNNRRGEQAA
ncbi:MAG: helix-turn-helix domain-containing protein [Rhizobiales bacterium]|nr:helix-turn-helix domain-containing protein [Hyphomicrobiales bacterium]